MKLIQTSILSSISTVTKMVTEFVILKLMAVYLGPDGLALCGQLKSFISIVEIIAAGGVGLGVIKYVAEYSKIQEKLRGFLSNTIVYMFFFSIIAFIICLVGSKPLAAWILGSDHYYYIIICIAFSLFFFALNILLTSTLNGFKQIKTLTKINIISAIASLLLMYILISLFKINGALIALILQEMVPLIVILFFIHRQKWKIYLYTPKFNKEYTIKLSHFSLMNIIDVLTKPLTQIIVRNDISFLLGWSVVGYWQAVMRISDAYLYVVLAALVSYYLPRLSELHDKRQLKDEIWQAHKIIMPAIFLIIFIIYICRDFIIHILFGPAFAQARDLFFYQFLGDSFRIAGWLSGYLLLAKSRVKTYIVVQIVLNGIFILTSHFAVRWYGVIGVTYCYAFTYFIYWLTMMGIGALYFKKIQ